MRKIFSILLIALLPTLAQAGCADDLIDLTNTHSNLTAHYTYDYNPFTGLFVTVWVVDTDLTPGSQVICLRNGYNDPEAVFCATLACLEDYLGL